MTWRRRKRQEPGIQADVTVTGEVSGQLAVGTNIVQMRVDRVLGNVVTVLPPGTTPTVTRRPDPIGLLPRRPVPVFDRRDETDDIVAELTGGGTCAVHGPPGAGKSTLLRHVAHRPGLMEAAGGVVHLSARGRSRDDLLHDLVDAFYATDVPVRSSPTQLRHRLQDVRAALLVDDVDLTGDAVTELADHAPRCGLAVGLAHPPPSITVRSMALPGLPPDAATQVLERALGRAVRPDEEEAAAALFARAAGVPGRLVALGAGATAFDGPLAAFAAQVEDAPTPPITVGPDAERVLGLLAAVPGIELDAEQLAAVSGVAGVGPILLDALARGLVVPADRPGSAGQRTYRLAGGVEPDPEQWHLAARRAELTAWFSAWADRRPDDLVVSAPAEPVRLLHRDAHRQRRWRSVLALGALLGAVDAAHGRWDAWHDVSLASLDAARALGDRRAEGLALHQLATEALCRGDLAPAREQLSAALAVRTAAGDRAGARVTRHNLDVVGVPPLPPVGGGESGDDRGATGGVASAGSHRVAAVGARLAKVPMQAWGTALLLPLIATLALIGAPTDGPSPLNLQPGALVFAAQPVNLASGAQSIRLGNAGRTTAQIDGIAITGRDRAEFTLLSSTCVGPLPPGGQCAATVAFAPVVTGARQAVLAWSVRNAGVTESSLSGTGTAARPDAPQVVPAALVFGDQSLDVLGPPRTVRLSVGRSRTVELGAGAVDVSGDADFLVTQDTCTGTTLTSRRTCGVTVRFAPGAQGPRSALVTVRDTAGDAVVAVPMSGSGVATTPAAVETAPASVAFGEQAVGTATDRPVTVRNRGPDPVDLGEPAVLGDGGFAARRGDCPARLPAGVSCTVTVTWVPTEAGARTAMLMLDAPGHPVVPLGGIGLPGPGVLPRLDPPAVDFGATPAGTTTAARTVTLTNRAPGPLQLGEGAITVTSPTSPAYTVDAAACTGLLLVPGGSCRLAVRFAPASPGAQPATLTVTVAGLDGSASALLTGTATAPDTVAVPDVTGRPRADALDELRAAGLRPGVLDEVPLDGVAAGTVADQAPPGGTAAAPGATVDLSVSTGPDLVPVPVLVGRPEAAATGDLDRAGLRTGSVERRPDPAVAPGTVLDSVPDAGQPVPRGAAVDLVVSTGTGTVLVPRVVGLPLPAALAALTGRRLVPGAVTTRPDAAVPEGAVVEGAPVEGTPVAVGSEVGLVVSSGAPPATVPPCAGVDELTATTRLGDAGLRPGRVTSQPDDRAPADQVLACRPGSGTVVPRGSLVDLTLSSGRAPAVVPLLTGRTVEEAGAVLDDAGLRPGAVTSRPDDAVREGLVVESRPPAATQVPRTTAVDLVVSSGPAFVTVPKVAGRPLTDVLADLRGAGLYAWPVSFVDDPAVTGTVRGADPGEGSSIRRGAAVALTVSAGIVTVPEVRRLGVAAATATLTAAGLKVADVVVDQFNQPVGNPDLVDATTPVAGTRVLAGSTVTLVVNIFIR